MPAKKGKLAGGSDPPSSASDSSDTDRPSKVKRWREESVGVEFLDETDAAELAVVKQEMIRAQSGRMVKVDSLAGRTAQVELLRKELADLKNMRDTPMMVDILRGERDFFRSQLEAVRAQQEETRAELELLRIAVKDADKLDAEIHMLEQSLIEKDERIANLLNEQVKQADESLVDDSAGVDISSPSPTGLSPKFDNMSFRGEKDDDDSD